VHAGDLGFFVQLAIFFGATNESDIAQQEFGPVGTAIPFKEEEKAIRIANARQDGLTASIWAGTSSSCGGRPSPRRSSPSRRSRGSRALASRAGWRLGGNEQ